MDYSLLNSVDASAYSYLKNHPFLDPYRQDEEFIKILATAKLKHDRYLKNYGSYVDEFLKTNN